MTTSGNAPILGRTFKSGPRRRNGRPHGIKEIALTQTDSIAGTRGKTTALYRIYDGSGTLIYVGVTDRGHIRQEEHLAKQRWAREVAETHWEHFEARSAALDRERWLIAEKHPKYNMVHRTEGEPMSMEYRLRGEQYDLLVRIHDELRRSTGVFNKFIRHWTQRHAALEALNAELMKAMRRGRPLNENELNRLDKLLRRLEHSEKNAPLLEEAA